MLQIEKQRDLAIELFSELVIEYENLNRRPQGPDSIQGVRRICI